MPPKVGLRCDGWPALGVGHVVRCLALADELLSRGVEVVFIGRVEGVPWVAAEVARRDLTLLPGPPDATALVQVAIAEGLQAVVLDGYHLDPGSGADLRVAGVRVLALVDGTFGVEQEADLYLDQNLDAETLSPHAGDNPPQLLGLRNVLFRDEVLAARHRHIRPPSGPPRLLTVFGGTDPLGGVEVLVPLVLGTGLAVELLAVCADPSLAERLELLPTGPGQVLTPVDPTPDLAALAAACDAVVTAAGSSVWEFMCLGVPLGVVTVAANQAVGYDAVVERGLALGVGDLARIRRPGPDRDQAGAVIRSLLTDVAGRTERVERAQRLIDGRGRQRVADRLLAGPNA